MAKSREVNEVVAELDARFPGRVQTGWDVRRAHANTLTFVPNQPPDAVFWPETTAEVAEGLRLATRGGVPVIPFGAGTSLEGHVNAPHGGISFDLSRMRRIIDINPRDFDCTVEAGVTRVALNAALRDTGLFFSVDPGAEDATLGGMAATRASGTNAVRYGTMRDNVRSLVAVLSDGEVVRTGGRARKSAAGFDLTGLLIGSEGTLGIITELTVKLHPVPAKVLVIVAQFTAIDQACNTTMRAAEMALGLARVELLDALQIRAVNIHSKTSLAEAPTLFVELHGSALAVEEQGNQFCDIAREHGATRLDVARTEDERRRLWRARHDAYWSVRTAWPGRSVFATDVCVPISRLADCVTQTSEDIQRLGLIAPIVGHVGDGNFHAIPVFDADDEMQLRAVREFHERLVLRALSMGGTCSGEHGIGQGKMPYLERELGRGTVKAMRAVKLALDPSNMLNPGKIFPI